MTHAYKVQIQSKSGNGWINAFSGTVKRLAVRDYEMRFHSIRYMGVRLLGDGNTIRQSINGLEVFRA